MKTKLIKINDIYTLLGEDNKMIASDDIDFQSDYKIGKLSKQNCDEIFVVVDAGKLAEEEIPYSSSTTINVQRMRFIHGFNKAMELNKDKLFTLEQVLDAFYAGWISKDKTYPEAQKSYKGYLERHVMQPTEIEVEVEMDRIPADLAPGGWDVFPRLDKEGCIILKKVL
jgi:hypothetical protein